MVLESFIMKMDAFSEVNIWTIKSMVLGSALSQVVRKLKALGSMANKKVKVNSSIKMGQ
jgi:hypothetical protein